MSDNQPDVHHSRSSANLIRVAVAEIIGSFFYVGTGLFMVSAAKAGFAASGGVADSLAIAVATGLALLVMVSALGHVSGAHLNPAISIAQVVARNLRRRYLLLYITCQLIGAIGAAAAVWTLLPAGAYDRAHLGIPTLASGITAWQAAGAEMMAGFLSGLVTISLTKDGRGPTGISAIPVGLATTVGLLVSGPISGGSFNPAKALAPMLLTGQFANWWLFLLPPIIGAAAAAYIYHRFLATAQPVQQD